MDASVFIPREFHLGLRNLGRHDWLSVEGREAAGDWTRWKARIDRAMVERAILGTPDGPDREAINRLMGYAEHNPLLVVSCEAVARMLADGPKVFRPSMQQCGAMENVAINLTLAEYQQAYPALVIEFPREYAESRRTHERILVRHDAAQRRLFCFAGNLVQGVIDTHTVINDHEDIEGALNRYIDHSPETPMSEQNRTFGEAVRVALNCNLALAHYATRLRALDPDLMKRLRQRSHVENPERRGRARRRLLGEFRVLEFSQEVAFHSEEPEHRARSEGDGQAHWEVMPHWRRGHWRRQPFGVGRAERKLVFIKPILVRRDKFAGDPSSTSVVYQTTAN